MKKRGLSLLLALCMALSLLPVSALVEEGTPIETPIEMSVEMPGEPRVAVSGGVSGSVTEDAVWDDVTLVGNTTLSSGAVV